MKKGTIFFHPIEGSAPLTISWSSQPKGNAVEAKKGDGVGFFSQKGDLLCVIFDEVQSDYDHQILEFDRKNRIEVTVKNGAVTYTVIKLKVAAKSKTASSKKRASTKLKKR